MIPETIQWQDAALELPDADLTVLGFREEWDYRTWPVFFDGEDWHNADGSTLTAGHQKPDFRPPTHWAPLPGGPETSTAEVPA